MAKHVFVTGGVVSSLGKGITGASLGRLLKSRGYKVTMQKLDPYLNVDPGTMSPYQHGEIFVTEDGHEGDLDLGHYERFIDENLMRESNVTQGYIYQSLINRERCGDYHGGTVQVIPHVTNEIKGHITNLAKQSDTDVVITEIGGTVGDIECLPFIEAARQFRKEQGPENVCFIHVSLVPYIPAAHEVKTKPTQHSVKELRGIGVSPDIIVCRSDHEIDDSIRHKIALFCDVQPDAVFSNTDLPSIYDVPLHLKAQGFDEKVCERLGLEPYPSDMSEWRNFLEKEKQCEGDVDIAVVGKYVSLPDAYFSVMEALGHAGVHLGVHANVHLVDGEKLTQENVDDVLKDMDAILVPGGFGPRGFSGKLIATQYARERNVPFLGIALGMQAALCEYARNVMGLEDANSTEFDPKTSNPILILPPGQDDGTQFGGRMRLGAHCCKLDEDSLARKAYGKDIIYERHRHRYEVNNAYRGAFEKAGVRICGLSPNGRLVEMIELPTDVHPWFVGTQAHPEFKSRPTKPHPLFCSFVQAAITYKEQK